MPGLQVAWLPVVSPAGAARPLLMLLFVTGMWSRPFILFSHTHRHPLPPPPESQLSLMTSGPSCSYSTWDLVSMPVLAHLGLCLLALSCPRRLVLSPLKCTAECLAHRWAFPLLLVIPRSFCPVSLLRMDLALLWACGGGEARDGAWLDGHSSHALGAAPSGPEAGV